MNENNPFDDFFGTRSFGTNSHENSDKVISLGKIKEVSFNILIGYYNDLCDGKITVEEYEILSKDFLKTVNILLVELLNEKSSQKRRSQ